MPRLGASFAELVRAQPWYEQLDAAGSDLIDAIVRCYVDAQRRGEAASVEAVLAFAAEQPWYRDGVDGRELAVLTGVFNAYGQSLKDGNAPPIGSILSSTLRNELFEVAQLPETGQFVVLVSADNAALGREALRLTLDGLPRVEAMVGKYPYTFMHVQVTRDLPEHILGVSYDQFIALRSDSVDAATVVHELTHSTLYGIFPTWFEEGLAHFVENYVNGTLPAGVRDFRADLRDLRRDVRLDLRQRGVYTDLDAYAERAQGFLFLNSVYEILGADGLSAAIRSLRTQSIGDQDLLKALARQGPPEAQAALTRLICNTVIGTIRDYCAPI